MIKYSHNGLDTYSSDNRGFCVVKDLDNDYTLGAMLDGENNFRIWIIDEKDENGEFLWVAHSREYLIELRNLLNEVLEEK